MTDYTSRFRLVFDYTGVEEDGSLTDAESNFAFQAEDQLVVNGEGLLQMFDVNGRCSFGTEVHGQQSMVSLPKDAPGVYILKLTNNNQIKTQKMIIR